MPSATGWWASSGASRTPPALDDALAMRRAGRELLSLALIASRNALLEHLTLDESSPALALAVRAGCWQEHWIGCHVQRQRGEDCDPQAPRLAGIQPRMAIWLAEGGPPPTPEDVRGYLAETLDVTLDLLACSGETDAALHFFRLALQHEDRLGEALALRRPDAAPPARVAREPLWLPAQRWQLGTDPAQGGLVPHNERWAHEVALPEFEIDAQPVDWARWVEFAEDGGYDRAELWSDSGWDWVQAHQRRAPQGVAQWRGGVVVKRGSRPGGSLQRAPAGQAATQLSRHEAEAWCSWAGRRLPTEPEWELAASRAASRGFVWGDVFEWVAGSARAWPGAGPAAPGALDAVPPAGSMGVLRGASFATPRRAHHPKARRFMPPGHDHAFCGFRSCAI